MLTKEQNSIEYLNEGSNAQIQTQTYLRPLKKKIDNKINRILMLLGQTPIRNADETEPQQYLTIAPIQKIRQVVSMQELCDDGISQTSTTLDPTPCKISQMTKSHGQHQNIMTVPTLLKNTRFDEAGDQFEISPFFNLKTHILAPQQCSQIPIQQNILDDELVQSEYTQKSIDEELSDSTNQFLSVKVSEDGSNPQMWVYNAEDDTSLPIEKTENFTPSQILQAWQTKSQGYEKQHCHNFRIIEVPEQLQEDNQQQILKDIKRRLNRRTIQINDKFPTMEFNSGEQLNNLKINDFNNDSQLNIRKKSNTIGSSSTRSGNNQNSTYTRTPLNSPTNIKNGNKNKMYQRKVQNKFMTISKPKIDQNIRAQINVEQATKIEIMNQLNKLCSKGMIQNEKKKLRNNLLEHLNRIRSIRMNLNAPMRF